MTAEKRLAAMKYRATAWEVALIAADGRLYRIGYSERKGKTAAYRIFTANIAAIAPLIDDADGEWNAKQQAFVSPTGWKVGFFTGRTKRDAIIEGELPKVEG